MNKLVRYWNQNRGKIILRIAIIAFLIIILQVVNNILENSMEEESTSTKVVETTQPIQSVITGEIVSEEITKSNTEVIEQFITECNNKNYENAYALLSDECKEVVFNNDINNFIDDYCNKTFAEKKTFKIELYLNQYDLYMYKVTFYNDNFLATGNADLNENLEDYITVVKGMEEDKINLNGFIKKQEINKTEVIGDVEITVNYKIIHKSYETYDFTIKNNSQKTVLLSTGDNNKDISIEDENNAEYGAYLYEISHEDLILKNGYEKNMQIKFDKIFSVYRNITKVKFKNIIKDYDYYINNPNSENIEKIEIGIEI